jgi:16S rRNA (guanine(966)-N(2))-methyltransferase RsmD
LRVTGGSLKGRQIATVKGWLVRYTPAKVRKAIFDMIGDVAGANVLELFAGSGAFSIEAMSRGAASATCVEIDSRVCRLLKKNAIAAGIAKDYLVINMDVRYALPFLNKKGIRYDIIFLDPPYGRGLAEKTMRLLIKNKALSGIETVFIVEHSKREMDKDIFTGLQMVTRKVYGDTVVSMFKAAHRNLYDNILNSNLEGA